MAKDSKAQKHSNSKAHKAPKKVFDVTRPGKSPASPNSRSVIVGHKPKVQDDQFVAEHTSHTTHWAGDPSEKRALMDSRKKIELNPGSGDLDSQSGDSGSAENTKFATKSTPSDHKDTVKTAPLVTKSASKEKKTEVAVGDVDSALANLSVVDFSSDNTEDSRVRAEKVSGAPVAADADVREGVPVQIKTAADSDTKPPVRSNGHSDNPATSELLADLAIEQVVEAKMYDEPSAENIDDQTSGDQINGDRNPLHNFGAASAHDRVDATGRADRPATVDDLLAETGAPDLAPQKAIVSTHHHHQGGGLGSAILIFFAVILLAAIAMNFLLDAEIIRTDLNLPYTDLIS